MNAHVAAIEALLAHEADVNMQDFDGCTPLMEVITDSSDYHPLIGALLAAGANPNSRDQTGRTPLIEASGHSRARLVEARLVAGADPNAVDATGRTPLLEAASNTRDYSVTKVLLAAGAHPNTRDPRGSTPLLKAAWYIIPECVEALLEAGADPNLTDDCGGTPLLNIAAGTWHRKPSLLTKDSSGQYTQPFRHYSKREQIQTRRRRQVGHCYLSLPFWGAKFLGFVWIQLMVSTQLLRFCWKMVPIQMRRTKGAERH